MHFNFQKLKIKNKKIAKISTVIQLEALDCAAACLAMILEHYKKFVPLEQLRIDCKITKHGSNAKNIIDAAQQHGLDAYGIRIEAKELKKNGKFPCIIHWNFNHFVVLAGFKHNKAILYDPATGLNKINFDNFNKSFTGICLNFKPKKDFKTGGKPKTTTNFFIQTLKNSLATFILFFIISILTLTVNIIKPGFLHFLVDRILTGQNKNCTLLFSIIAAATTITDLLLIWFKTVYFLKIKGKLSAQSNCQFIWHLLHLPIDFFSNRFTGDIQLRQKFNAVIANQIVSEITPLILNITNIMILFTIMLRYSVFLTISISLTSLITVVISNFSSKKQLELCKIKIKYEGQLNAITIASLDSIESIKINGSENQFFQQWADAQANLNAQTLKDPPFANIPNLIANLSQKATIVLGAFLLMERQLTLGMIITFNAFLKMMIKPLCNFLKTNQNLQNIKTKIERVEDIMNFKLDNYFTKNKTAKTFNKLSGKIEIKNLKFSHIGENKAIFNGLNLTIQPGEKIAIVGPSGCGKTTLINLLTGILKQQQGQILFDGKTINEVKKSVFRNCIAIVNHNPLFFSGTIKNNLTMWDDNVSDLNLIESTKKAQIYDSIVQHGGFNCQITKNAENFSYGQKQQLEIARALAQNPQILILDEALSAIDSQTKLKIFEQIFKEKFSCILVSKSNNVPKYFTKIFKLNQIVIKQ